MLLLSELRTLLAVLLPLVSLERFVDPKYSDSEESEVDRFLSALARFALETDILDEAEMGDDDDEEPTSSEEGLVAVESRGSRRRGSARLAFSS